MDEHTTIIHMLEANAAKHPSRVAYADKLTGSWRTATWQDYNERTRQIAKALMALEFAEGNVVTILSANRPDWTNMALGAMRCGGIAAGIYTSNSPDEVAYIVGHAESPVIVLDSAAQLAKVAEVWDQLPSLREVVMMPDTEFESDDDRVLSWDAFMSLAEQTSDDDLAARMNALRPDQVADFIYTSGTTGPPKAVMLTHENLAWTATMMGNTVELSADEETLSYLPLSHIAEQMATIHMPLAYGYRVNYCHDGLQLAEYLREVRPTTFFGVPRVWERIQAGIEGQFAEATGVKAKLIDWTRSVATEHAAVENSGGTPSPMLARKMALADKLVFSKVKAAIGMDRNRIRVAGAAPLSTSTHEFFASIGLPILELYGQSEDSGPTTTNLPGANKIGTVGRPFPGVEVELGDDGEIRVRGKNVFAGYYKNQEATDETLEDGWLLSGDLGSFDDDGYLSITGRKKDIIITSGGKNVAPRNLEDALTGLDVVAHAVCCGEQQRFLVALLTLEPEAAGRFAEDKGIPVDGLAASAEMRSYVESHITSVVNPQFARVEHIRNFVVLPHEFTTATGELTPTFKVKRNVVNDMYANEIAALYEEGQLL